MFGWRSSAIQAHGNMYRLKRIIVLAAPSVGKVVEGTREILCLFSVRTCGSDVGRSIPAAARRLLPHFDVVRGRMDSSPVRKLRRGSLCHVPATQFCQFGSHEQKHQQPENPEEFVRNEVFPNPPISGRDIAGINPRVPNTIPGAA